MRAVNLIPDDLRRGSSAAGRSGSSVYVLLGVLGVLVVLASVWTIADRTVADRQNDLVRVESEAQQAEVRAGALAPYTKFAELRDKRVETVTSLSRTRFNWPYALREISRVVPDNVSLTSLVGTVAPGVAVEGAGGGGTSGLRGALAVPAVELSGCTVDQENVARYLARLRSIDGVTRVSLASSEKNDSPADVVPAATDGASSAPDGGGDCRQGDQTPRFDAVVFFERSTATASAPVAGGAVPAPSASASATGSTATPAGSTSSTPPAPSPSTPTSSTGSR
jgi:Tfp pilus assembly protein PilN